MQSHGLSSSLHRAFQKALKVGKRARHLFPLRRENGSLPALIWQMAESMLGSLQAKKIILVGYSEVNRSLASFFLHRGALSIALATKEPTQGLVGSPEIHVQGYELLATWEQCDLLISATEARDFLIYKQRTLHQKVLIFDLSVPRTVDPLLAQEPYVSLWNIDDLMATRNDLKSSRQRANEEFIAQAAHRTWAQRRCGN